VVANALRKRPRAMPSRALAIASRTIAHPGSRRSNVESPEGDRTGDSALERCNEGSP
jgi:hypothetical protein